MEWLSTCFKNMVRTTSDKQIQGLKHVMESFTIFTSSAIVDHIFYITFCNKALQNDWVWLATASEVQK